MKPSLSSTSVTAPSSTSSSRSPLASSSGGLLPSTSSSASPLISSTTPPASEEPSPTDLLLATPPTLLKLFALTAPFLSLATTFCQLVTWQHPNFFASLLVLLAWWGICLFGRWIAIYGFNLGILVYIGSRYFRTATKQATSKAISPTSSASSSSSYRHARPPTLTPAAYSHLLTSSHFLFSHLQSFRSSVIHPLSLHFSFTPSRPSTPAPAYSTARLALTSYPFYLVLTYLIPLRYIFLLLGSIAILWNAPFFMTLRTLLWRSATIRWIVRLTSSVLLNGGKGFREEWNRTKSGVGIPGLLGKKKYGNDRAGVQVVEEKVVKTSVIKRSVATNEVVEETKKVQVFGGDKNMDIAVEEESEEDVEVQFTVFENQRWWVGLDWTHALLPGERASWTDPSSNPSNPPASFNLPPPQITYVASPTASDPASRLKKTTAWRWLDPEWKVLRESLPSVALPVSVSSPVLPGSIDSAHSPPSPTSHSSSIFSSLPSPPANLLSASLASSTSASPVTPTSFSNPGSLISDPHSRMFETWSVDQEGWQYGDNHFEKMGKKGGLGKYTRRRAWVRRAGLVETTERVSGAVVGVVGVVGEKEKDEASLRGRTRKESGGGDKSRRKSESRHSTIGVEGNVGSTGLKTSSSVGGLGQVNQARKRKSMPPTMGSEQSISKDVD